MIASVRKEGAGYYAVLLFSLGVFNLLPAQVDSSDIIAHLRSSVGTVTTYDSEGHGLTVGCGFFTDKEGYFVTNRHVIAGSDHAEVGVAAGRYYEVKEVIAEDKEGDLIMFSVDIPRENVQPLAITPTCAEVGERIVVLGPARGGSVLTRDLLEGEVSGVRNIQGFGSIIEITAPLSSGFSGSPVVNMRGEVLGIATFQIVKEDTVNFAVPAARLEQLVPDAGKTIKEWEEERGGLASSEELYLEGVHLLWAQDWEAALASFERVVDENPIYVVAYPLIGYCNIQLARWDDAIEAYYQSLLVTPSDAWAYNNIAVAYGRLDRWGEAMASYRQAIRLAPDNANFHCGLGTAYVKLGKWDEAMMSFRKAVRLDPNFADAHYGLGLSYWVFEDMDSAWQEYAILRRLDEELARELLDYLND